MSGALLAASAIPAFARHETFHPRYGWLRKAYTGALRDPGVFLAPDVTVQLGVGKNMANAIRFWSHAYKVLEEVPNPRRPRLPLVGPSDFGRALFDEDRGWDPYLENLGTLWLLHWNLFIPPCSVPAWWVTFNAFPLPYFSESQLVSHVVELAAAAGWPKVVEASVKKDVECVLRMYASRRHGRQTLDDLLDSPFRELRLIEGVPGDSKTWRFAVSDSAGPPPLIVAFACLDFVARVDEGASSVSLARLATDAGSPGCVFRLSESGLLTALTQAVRAVPRLRLVDSVGRPQLMLDAPAGGLARSALKSHYSSARVLVGASL
jgi:Protein of unknown function (DUF4007)